MFDGPLMRALVELRNHPAFESDEALDRWLGECEKKYPLTEAQRAFVAEAMVRGEKRLMDRIRRAHGR